MRCLSSLTPRLGALLSLLTLALALLAPSRVRAEAQPARAILLVSLPNDSGVAPRIRAALRTALEERGIVVVAAPAVQQKLEELGAIAAGEVTTDSAKLDEVRKALGAGVLVRMWGEAGGEAAPRAHLHRHAGGGSALSRPE